MSQSSVKSISWMICFPVINFLKSNFPWSDQKFKSKYNLNFFFSPLRLFSNKSKAENSPQYLQTLIKVQQQQKQMQVWNTRAEIMKFKMQYSGTKLMPIWNLKISITSRIKFQIRFNSNISWTDHWKNAMW